MIIPRLQTVLRTMSPPPAESSHINCCKIDCKHRTQYARNNMACKFNYTQFVPEYFNDNISAIANDKYWLYFHDTFATVCKRNLNFQFEFNSGKLVKMQMPCTQYQVKMYSLGWQFSKAKSLFIEGKRLKNSQKKILRKALLGQWENCVNGNNILCTVSTLISDP